MARKKYLVEKRNILNDIIVREFTLQELRLFSIYLGLINARDLSTRIVRFPLTWFYRIMDLQPMRVEYLESVTHDLLTKVVRIPTEAGGYSQFQLFKECRVDKGQNGQWYFEIDAHDKALPFMFDYKRDYFTYELWNVLNLESVNQFRMYELLKEFERYGERVITVDDLKALLGIEDKEYAQWNNFRLRVLNACQKALKEKTDICYTYEIYSRGGRGGRIQSLRFTIIRNINNLNQLNLNEFLGANVIENAKQEANPEPEADIAGLSFIKEPLPDRDKLSVLQAASGDIEIVRTAYDMAKQQGGVESLTAWLIAMVKKIRNGEITPHVKVNVTARQNRFVNFMQRDIDFAELERLENELLKASMTDEQWDLVE